MPYQLNDSIEILQSTPAVLKSLLGQHSIRWTHYAPDDRTWSPVDIVAHLILGEETDWVPRTRIFLSDEGDKKFTPFDMTGHLEMKNRFSLHQLLDRFSELRHENLVILQSFHLTEKELDRTALHPEYGTVTLRQHLSTWTVHDLNHINQINRVMAKRWKDEVGPWKEHQHILR